MNRRFGITILLTVCLLLLPTWATGQTSLTELGAANAARNQVIGDSAQAAVGAQQADVSPASSPTPSKATKSVGFGGMSYVPSYTLMLTLIGLGVFLVCRPSHRHEPE